MKTVRPRSIPSLLSLWLGLGCAALPAFAQPVPKLATIAPEWIQRGTTAEIVLTGENLGAVTGFLFDGEPGLTASNVPPPVAAPPAITIAASGISVAPPALPRDEKRIVVKITAGADTALVPREVRVLTAAGVSNPLLLNVGQLPEIAEAEPNDTPETAQFIYLPAALSGNLNASAQLDHFRFGANKGQELVFEVDASRRGSALDSTLILLNAEGKELARNEDANGLDSLLFFTVPADGQYILQLRDFRYAGGNQTYRLYAGVLPYVESIFPLGGQRGKTVEVALAGRNLEGTRKMTLNIAPAAPLGRQDIRAQTPKGYSNPVAFEVSDFPDVTETEPNNTLTNANTVPVPVNINGRIGEPKDLDRFKFKSPTDQKLVCEITASRFGSPLDALLILTDTNGAVLQQVDDTSGSDARLEFDAKKDVEYLLAVRDLTDRGGEKFAYRLAIRPPSAGAEAGFTVRFLPETLRVNREGQTRLRGEVTRVAGFDGPVLLALENLPAGVFAEPLALPNGPASGLMLLTASQDTPLGTFPIRLVASAIIGGKTVTRVAEPLSGDKPVKQAYLTVLDAAPFRLELLTLNATLEQNQTATVEVLAQRRAGFTGEIKLHAEGFSAGRESISNSFTVGDAAIKSGETVGRLPLTAKLASEIGTRTLVLRGEATVDGQAVAQFSGPLPVTVTQFPFVLSSTLARLMITALPPGSASSANETATIIKVERRDGFTGELVLTLDGLPAGVTSVLEKIPANGGETTLKLTATPKAAIGTNFSLTVTGTGVHKDKNYKTKTGAITLQVSPPEMIELATNSAPATATSPAK